MKKLILLPLLLGILLGLLVGCGKDEENYPTLTYMVDGTVFYEDVLESEGERFGKIGKEPTKEGFYFGGWYYDDGTFEEPLSYTELNLSEDKSDVCVYAKWEVVALSYDESTRTYTVEGLLSGAGEDVVIPAKFGELPVTAIAAGAFRGNTALKSVTIPDSVKSIGEYAFAECTGLTRVVVPNAVTVIGRGAFSNCISLTEAKLSTALVEISVEAFANCRQLPVVNIPATVEKIGARAFSGCEGLSDVRLPLSLKTIGTAAFRGTAITSLKYAGSANSWSRVEKTGFSEGSLITSVICSDQPVTP